MSTKSPIARVKEQFGDKEKLVEAVQKLGGDDLWVARTNESKGLAHVSNAKLLRLHRILTEVKEKFGTREKLVDAILELEKRAKDAGYKQRLSAWPVPRLWDTYRSTAKRHGQATAPTAKPKAAAAPAAAKAKKAPAKKTAAKSAG
ncbi:MAG TPA: hypothetical protein VF765_22505 [Polyangiaceae bacterium]